jgi:hypothetical protein
VDLRIAIFDLVPLIADDDGEQVLETTAICAACVHRRSIILVDRDFEVLGGSGAAVRFFGSRAFSSGTYRNRFPICVSPCLSPLWCRHPMVSNSWSNIFSRNRVGAQIVPGESASSCCLHCRLRHQHRSPTLESSITKAISVIRLLYTAILCVTTFDERPQDLAISLNGRACRRPVTIDLSNSRS